MTEYVHKTIVESIKSLLCTKQKRGEHFNDYFDRFKANKDVLWSHIGKDFKKMLMSSKNYLTAVTVEEKSKVKAEVVECFLAYLLMANSDQNKYGSLLKRFSTDHAFKHGESAEKRDDLREFPTTMSQASTIFNNHTWDAAYKKAKDAYEKKLDKQEQNESHNNNNSEDDGQLSLSFAQTITRGKCYCCGRTNHTFSDCRFKNQTPKDQWYINKNKEVKQYNQIIQEITTHMNTESNSSGQNQTGSGSGSNTTSSSNSTSSNTENTWQHFQYFSGLQNESHMEDTIILDSGSGIDLFCNADWLQDIHLKDVPIIIGTNAGSLNIDQEGTLASYGKVPFSENAVTNIMSLALLSDKYTITMNTAVDNAIYVHTPQKVVRFGRDSTNVYSHTPTKLGSCKPIAPAKPRDEDDTAPSFVQSVEENKLFYTPKEVTRAKRARDLLAALGTPSIADLKAAIAMNAIANLPVTTADVNLAEKIFGKDIGTLKGKTTRSKPLPQVKDSIELPPEIGESRDSWELCIDIMFVNKIPFMTTISKALYYRTAIPMINMKQEELYNSIDKVFRLYNSGGFVITDIHADNQFNPVFDAVNDEMGITMHNPPAHGHVPEAERNNRFLKERIRATYHRLPYKALPTKALKVLVMESAKKPNYFPNKHGISKYFSPRQILHRENLDYEKHCKYYFGQYVQAHDEPQPLNSQEARTLDALYMRPLPLGHQVYDLTTDELVTRHKVTPLPVPNHVIEAVNNIAAKQGHKGLKIQAKDGTVLYDSTWTAGVDYESDDEDYDPEEEDFDSDAEDSDIEDDDCSTTDSESDSDSSDDESRDIQEDIQEAREILHSGPEDEDTVHSGDDLKDEDPAEDEDSVEIVTETPEVPHVEPRRSSRQPKPRQMLEPTYKGQSYDAQMHLQTEEANAEEYSNEIARYWVQMMQAVKERFILQARKVTRKKAHKNFLVTYSLNKGLKKFKQKGFDAAKGEMQQLHDRSCWQPIHVSTMTQAEKAKALESLIFLVEKKDGRIKARHCANGSKQRQWIKPEDAASPTVMTDSILLTAGIEAKERRDVATWDIPNAFIQTAVEELDEDGDRIVMKIRGAMVDMLLELDPKYEEFVVFERGQKVLYVHILRAIYGMLQSGLLYYKKFRAAIEGRGYVVNDYDPCVANKMINGKQHTLSWHVDDLKGSHVDPKVNDEFGGWLQKEFGQIKEVTGTRGKKHVYLGMTLDYSTPGEVKIDMVDYVKAMIEDFPVELDGKVSTPANDHLFKIDKGKPLGEMKKEVFHGTVAKALFLTMRARPDIRLTVAFLCTRVKEPTTYDWFKLTRMMNYLKKTVDDCLIIELGDLSKTVWGVDASYAVHADGRSHSGMSMQMGKGAITSMSRKQKLVTRSSTEAELVAVDDCMSQVLWTKYFLEEQGYPVKATIILQDNSSAIKLENNGQKSMGQRSRHINNRYFFITDQISKGNVQVEYCPTDEMEADYMSKPLQGTKFAKHRGTLMNIGEPTNVKATKPKATKAAKSVSFGQVVYHKIEAR